MNKYHPYLNIFDEPPHHRAHVKAGNSSVIAVGAVALVVALLALWAYNSTRVDQDLNAGDVDQDTVLGTDEMNDVINNPNNNPNRPPSEAEIAAARLDARTELLAIQAKLEAENDAEAAIASVEALEADLERSYANATGEMRQEWEELKTEFDTIEQGLRSGSADTANILAGLLLMFEAEVRTDEEE